MNVAGEIAAASEVAAPDGLTVEYLRSVSGSKAALAALERLRAMPLERVRYQDLESAIWSAWGVRPEDVTVHDLRFALGDVLRESKGGMELDRTSCEQYGIDYDSLLLLLRFSPAGDASDGPKVPRKSMPRTAASPTEREGTQLAAAEAGAAEGTDHVTAIPPRRKRGRPTKISESTKEEAVAARGQKKSWRDTAKILYGSKYPSIQEVKNAPNVLRYYLKTRANTAEKF